MQTQAQYVATDLRNIFAPEVATQTPALGLSGAIDWRSAVGINPTVRADGSIDPAAASRDPENALGALTKAQWDDFIARYKPLEIQLTRAINADPTAEIAKMASYADMQSASAQGALGRDIERRGLAVTQDQAEVMARLSKNQAMLNNIGATETARRAINDRGLQTMADLISVGKGIAGSASNSLQSAAQQQASRTASDKAAEASATQANYATAGQVIGTALGFALRF